MGKRDSRDPGRSNAEEAARRSPTGKRVARSGNRLFYYRERIKLDNKHTWLITIIMHDISIVFSFVDEKGRHKIIFKKSIQYRYYKEFLQ